MLSCAGDCCIIERFVLCRLVSEAVARSYLSGRAPIVLLSPLLDYALSGDNDLFCFYL